MKRRKNGDIYEIDLHPFFKGFAYAKYIQIDKYLSSTFYGDILLVHDTIFNDRPSQIKDCFFSKLLMNPIYIIGASALSKMFPYIANFPVTEENKIFPMIRVPANIYEEDSGIEVNDWNVIDHNQKTINIAPLAFKDVAHLNSLSGVTIVDYLSFFISFEVYKTMGEKFPHLDNLDWIQQRILRFECPTLPLSKVPLSKRFKID